MSWKSKPLSPGRMSRRSFVRCLSAAASGMLLGRCAGAGGPADLLTESAAGDQGGAADTGGRENAAERTSAPSADAVLLGLYSRSAQDAEGAVRQACQELDWSWLKPGDSVFVKLACNSGNAHPAVTSPAAVRGVCRELLDRGASKVLAGDQSGIEYVRLAAGDVLTGSTRNQMQKTGLLAAIEESGAQAYCFEEHGYEQGYFAGALDVPGSHWTEAPRIASVIRDVDHIVTLPRMSSHLIAGCSLGLKCSIGWLRDDSRYLLHFLGSTIHEKYVEVNWCSELATRHRLTLTLAEKVLLDAGPDVGTVAEAEPMLVVASHHMVNHDAVASALLAFMDTVTPPDPDLLVTYGQKADDVNHTLVSLLVPAKYGGPWGPLPMDQYTPVAWHDYQKGISSDRALLRGYEILGGMPAGIPVRLAGDGESGDIITFLKERDAGIYGV
jgi:uncharacterized protein (DUF362 family)